MSKYFRNSLQCIYLDQFAVSNICDVPDENWMEISRLVKKGVKLKRMICPSSIEHLLETSGKPLDKAAKHDEEFKKLSCGWSFYPEPEISAHHIICRLRSIKKTKHHFIRKKKGSIKWRDVESLLKSLGAILSDRAGSRVAVLLRT